MSWYTTGAVNVINGSKIITGINTQWADPKNGISTGQIFIVPEANELKLHEVLRVNSNTELVLNQGYSSESGDGQQYAIITTYIDTLADFSRRLASQLAYYQEQLDGWQEILTGADDITITAPDGSIVTIPSMSSLLKWSIELRDWFDVNLLTITNAEKFAIRAEVAMKEAEKQPLIAGNWALESKAQSVVASGYATTAEESATNSDKSSTAAQQSAVAAAQSQSATDASKNAAAAFATNAETAKNTTVSIQKDVTKKSTAATTAANNADYHAATALVHANAAKKEAELSGGQAIIATTAANDAKRNAEAAANSGAHVETLTASVNDAAALVAHHKYEVVVFRNQTEEFAKQAKASAASIDISVFESRIRQLEAQILELEHAKNVAAFATINGYFIDFNASLLAQDVKIKG